MTRQLVKVVPGEINPEGFTKTQGTRVVLPSGESLPGVKRLTLHAEPGNDVWTAVIEVACVPPESISCEKV